MQIAAVGVAALCGHRRANDHKPVLPPDILLLQPNASHEARDDAAMAGAKLSRDGAKPPGHEPKVRVRPASHVSTPTHACQCSLSRPLDSSGAAPGEACG